MDALGMYTRTASACDKKHLARTFLKLNSKAEHIFADMGSQSAGEGFCTVHQTMCKLAQGVDIAVGGLPCQPFSRMRTRHGPGNKEGAPTSHPSFDTVNVEFFEYLRGRTPLCFLVEEITAMRDQNADSGEPYLDSFMEQCASLGYAMRAIMLDHGNWCEMSRSRQHIRSEHCSVAIEGRARMLLPCMVTFGP